MSIWENWIDFLTLTLKEWKSDGDFCDGKHLRILRWVDWDIWGSVFRKIEVDFDKIDS